MNSIKALCICVMFLISNHSFANNDSNDSIQVRGGCGPVTMGPATLNSLLEVNGTAGCVFDLYNTADNCALINDTASLNYLGTFTLGAAGQVNPGIAVTPECYMAFQSATSTNPLGRMFVPQNYTNVAANVATIGGSVSINISLDGVDGTLIYNGTTYDGLPTGAFVLNNISANATSVITRANGFDGSGVQIFDEVSDNLDFVPPTCGAMSQIPDTTVSPVDFGTVITLTLNATGATNATVDGISLTPDVDPNNNNSVNWEATHTAVEDTTLVATLTNPDGEQTFCTWQIDIFDCPATFFSVAPVGQVGIVIQGNPFCTNTITVTDSDMNVTIYDVEIGADGFGTLNIVIPPDSLLEVDQDSFMTGPLPNTVPVASSISISGTLEVNSLLTGNYGYTDAENDSEGNSTYQWYRNGNPIAGATGNTYTTVVADSGKTIRFEVTPVAQSGASPGLPIISGGVVIGAIMVPTLSNSLLLFLMLLIGAIGFSKQKQRQT